MGDGAGDAALATRGVATASTPPPLRPRLLAAGEAARSDEADAGAADAAPRLLLLVLLLLAFAIAAASALMPLLPRPLTAPLEPEAVGDASAADRRAPARASSRAAAAPAAAAERGLGGSVSLPLAPEAGGDAGAATAALELLDDRDRGVTEADALRAEADARADARLEWAAGLGEAAGAGASEKDAALVLPLALASPTLAPRLLLPLLEAACCCALIAEAMARMGLATTAEAAAGP